MDGYNSAIYNSYIRNNDYVGLADYISQFKPKDKVQREELKQYVNTLKRYGHIASAVINNTQSTEERDLVSFNLQRENGLYGIKNKYAQEYGKNLNNIGGNKASYIDYEFADDDSYTKFINNSNLNIGGYDKNNPTSSYHYMNNGRHTIRIQKTAFNNSKFFDALNKGLDSLIVPVTVTGSVSAFIPSYTDIIPYFKSTSYDENGNQLDSKFGYFKAQADCAKLVNSAESTYKNTLNKCYSKVMPSELVSMGYMCDAQRQLNEGAKNGTITEAYYNLNTKIIKDYYDTQLKQLSLTHYDVYAIGENETSQTFNAIGNEDKGKYTALIRAAAKQDRVTVGAGMAGGRVGTIITIAPKLDEKGNFGKEGNAGYQFFVPGLFEEDARNVMDKDDNAKVMVDLAEHQAFNTPYKLVEGGYIKDFDGNGATFTNDIGNVRMDNATIRLQMLRNTWLEQGIESVKDYMEDNPNYYQNNNLNKLIETFAINMYSRLYGSPYETDGTTITTSARNEINDIIQIITSKVQ